MLLQKHYLYITIKFQLLTAVNSFLIFALNKKNKTSMKEIKFPYLYVQSLVERINLVCRRNLYYVVDEDGIFVFDKSFDKTFVNRFDSVSEFIIWLEYGVSAI